MTYQQFSEYSLYLALREFLRVNQGQESVLSLDTSYAAGSKINAEALLQHPMGRVVAALGRAMHEGGVLPGWNNDDGTMDWGKFSVFVRWFARLNKQQQTIAIARMRAGSETPWLAATRSLQTGTTGAAQGVQHANPSVPGRSAGMVSASDFAPAAKNLSIQDARLASQKDNEGIGIAGWAAIIAALIGIGYLLYKILGPKLAQNPESEGA
jgi:hypothetical protein